MPFKYAFNTWAYSCFPVWVPSYPFEEAIRRIARIGYDAIEIGCSAPHAWPAHLSAGRRRDLKSLIRDEGLVTASLLPTPGGGPGNNPCSPLIEERTSAIAHYKEVVDLAHDLDAPRVLFIAGWRVFGTSREEAWNWSREALIAVARHASDRGVSVIVEPTPAASNLVDTAGEALQLRAEAGLPNIKVMFDTYHALYRNEVSSDYVYEMAPHLDHVHCADTDRLPPGEGAVDWLSVLQALKDTSFPGYLTMEIGFDTRNAEPDRYARSALRYLKATEDSLV